MARPVSGSVAQQVETLFDGGSVPGLSDRQLLDRFTVRGVGQDLLVALGIDDPRFARLTVPVETGGAVDPQSVTIALEPARIITGRITDAETGKPIPHTQIHITSHRKMGL